MLEDTVRTNFNAIHFELGDTLIAVHPSSNRIYSNNGDLENIVFAPTRYLHRNTPEWRRDIQNARAGVSRARTDAGARADYDSRADSGSRERTASVPSGRARFQERVMENSIDALKIAGFTSLDIGALALDIGVRASTYAAYYTAEVGSRAVETAARGIGRGVSALSKRLYHFIDTSCDSLDHNGTSAPKRYLNRVRTYCHDFKTIIKSYVTEWIDSRRNPAQVRSNIKTGSDYFIAGTATTIALYAVLSLGSLLFSPHEESIASERARDTPQEIINVSTPQAEERTESIRQSTISQPTTDLPTTPDTIITNTNAYILTVNPQNTEVLRSIGWLGRTSVQNDYGVLGHGTGQDTFEQFRREFTNGNYGILVLTGHHQYGAGYLFGDYYASSLDFSSLPSSDSVEAVFFSACNTVRADQETIDAVYKPLIAKFPNLKVIAGFKTGAGLYDGIVPQFLSTERYSLRNGARHFAEEAINVNPDRVAVAVKEQDGWYVYSMENSMNNNQDNNVYPNIGVPPQLTATPLGIR
ncbi:hypothetical protein HY636_00265 [Candidatus Woesearchaeota archaeon]|nr:hypothetical protein [Candidatus Woesearchaeota archaeon]